MQRIDREFHAEPAIVRRQLECPEQLVAEMRNESAIAAERLAGEDFADFDMGHPLRQQLVQTAGRDRHGRIRSILERLHVFSAALSAIVDLLRDPCLLGRAANSAAAGAS